MAVTNAGQTSLTFTNLPIGVQVTKITDTSADWASVANSTYFYDKGDRLVHYKNSGGTVLELFSAGGLTYFTEAQNNGVPNNIVNVDALTAVAPTASADFAIVPKGSGALITAIPNGGGPEPGAKRGAYAVDLQLIRSFVTRVASGDYSVALGRENTASATDAITIGSNANATNSQAIVIGTGTASGSGSAVFGYGTASNLQSFSVGYLSSASGQESMGVGHYNTCSGAYGYSLGRENTSSGIVATTIGQQNIASGSRATAIGHFSTASGDYSIAEGFRASTFGIYGRQSYASGRFVSNGDAQKGLLVLRTATPSDTPTILTSDAGVAAATNQLFINQYSTIRFKGTIVGIEQGGGASYMGVWDIDGVMSRAGGNNSLVIGNVNLVTNPSSFGTPTLAVDTATKTLRVQVTGLAGVPAQWVATIEITELIYA